MAGAIVRCKEAFAFAENGMNRVVHTGELVSTDDPAFTDNRGFFENVETHFDKQRKMTALAQGKVTPEQVEQATAAPGEKRTVVRTPVADEPVPVKQPSATARGAAKDATVKANDSKSK